MKSGLNPTQNNLNKPQYEELIMYKSFRVDSFYINILKSVKKEMDGVVDYAILSEPLQVSFYDGVVMWKYKALNRSDKSTVYLKIPLIEILNGNAKGLNIGDLLTINNDHLKVDDISVSS